MKTKHQILLAGLAILSSGCAFGPPWVEKPPYAEPLQDTPPSWTQPASQATEPVRAAFMDLSGGEFMELE